MYMFIAEWKFLKDFLYKPEKKEFMFYGFDYQIGQTIEKENHTVTLEKEVNLQLYILPP